jgi:hypothetical protein
MAKVGDLEIETPKIADGAITGSVTSTEYVEVANPSGLPILLAAQATVQFTGAAEFSGTTSSATATLKRQSDGHVFYTWGVTRDGRDVWTYVLSPQVLDVDGPVDETYRWQIATSVFNGSGGGSGGAAPPTISGRFVNALYVQK